ncbi:LCP family protein [Bacillus massiliglaciei]|uniref:LCP family protein n=1 Tax=Bacillus massiliglaciei TaxID=1816693 RepID=UPI000B030642|nr:LCP family protein [Bacillus massiliglaciei]
MKRKMFLFSFFFLLFLTGCKGTAVPEIPSEHKSANQGAENQASDSVKTFLLIGTDSRGEADSRADTIILARLNPKVGKLKLASIMRDSYVDIPGHRHNKINAAYRYGGVSLLKETIKKNFKVEIDYTAVIDFKGFAHLVDVVAPEGIYVHVKQEMIEDMSLPVSSGMNVLHGEEILKYVRFRHDDESDFGRVKRQQEVIGLLKEAAVKQFSGFEGLLGLPHAIKEGLRYIDTDMDSRTIIELSASSAFTPIQEIETMRIPMEGSFQDTSHPHAGEVLELDFQKNNQALRQFLAK